MIQTTKQQNNINASRLEYPIFTASELARKLTFKQETLPVFQVVGDELVKKMVKTSAGVMLEVHDDGFTSPADMSAFYRVGWAFK
jgi:hypothetical protein